MYRIVGADGREYGPISADQLRQWIAEGRANAQTKVLLEGTTEWKSLGEFPEFFPSGAPAAAPISPGTIPPPPPPMPAYTPVGGPASDQVSGPAIGLMVVAIIGFILQAGSLALRFLGISFMAQEMPSQAWGRLMSGTLGIATNVIAILVSGLILVGALKMRRLENYNLAMAASVIAMIPCLSPCCLIGLPIGIWAVVVLSKPEVKSAFH
jgi:hypothetical protein